MNTQSTMPSETHLTPDDMDVLRRVYGRQLLVMNSADPERPSASAGVAFILNRKTTDVSNIEVTEVVPGRALLLKTTWHKG